jgi:hypothetical protein
MRARSTPRNPTRDPAVNRLEIAVAVADDARGRIYDVAAACRAVGFNHTVTLAGVGLLTGSMESRDLGKLLAVPGVLMVEVKHEFQSGIDARVH